MRKNTGKVREKSENFVSLEKWEPCMNDIVNNKGHNLALWKNNPILTT